VRKKELIKSYDFFDIKKRMNDKGDKFVYIETRDRVEFIFIYEGEIYWRSEYNPAHCQSNDEYNYYPFSTTIEDDEIPIKAVERKIEEEAGLVVEDTEILYKGYFFESKHIASRVHLFIIEIKKAKKVAPRTDRTYWKSFGKTLAAKDKETFFKELDKKIIDKSLSLEFLSLKLKNLN